MENSTTKTGRRVRVTMIIEEHLLHLEETERRIDAMLTKAEEQLGVRKPAAA